jgi:fumarate hydratase subunit beta
MVEKRVATPLTIEKVKTLNAGDPVLLTGTVYTARDAAHKRLADLLKQGKQLPFDLEGAVIYYVGPTPARPGQVIGSAGPTTSYRMDPYTPVLLNSGLKGMIGKGLRSREVTKSIMDNCAVYFTAIGGAAALIAKAIVSAEIVAYEELGSEAIRKFEVRELPLIVTIDCKGQDLYEIGPQRYLSGLRGVKSSPIA